MQQKLLKDMEHSLFHIIFTGMETVTDFPFRYTSEVWFKQTLRDWYETHYQFA